MAEILDGKKLSQEVLTRLKKKIKSGNLKLGLAIIAIGKNKVSKVYLKQKKIACQNIGIGFRLYHLPKSISQKRFEERIKKIIRIKENSGIVIQLPLPFNPLLTSRLFNLIPSQKDIDCLGQVNFSSFCQGNKIVMPPVVSAISKLFKKYKIQVKGKKVLIVGKGRLVGQPLITWLSKTEGEAVALRSPLPLQVLVADKSTKDLAGLCRQADIIISGAGQANLIKGSMIKKGAIVIDVGASTEKGRVLGDVEKKSVLKKASFLAPVPGGVGPLTIACLLENLVNLNSK
ncbi:bifunctional 5,10-methylenetetrahydrofolate dehydrogenase/5,10-methenyltetrahydrofolate cyclohydrolase [Patescibacteria group bacterium]|nr:bifunctional 5,10-methylenetetrahydrofolate dehydrogenase/5,10-methenyltetrahydrofolate cyclohydrolase [Patescibacteria group bacterium]